MAFNREKALKAAEKLVTKGKDREAIAKYEEIVKEDPSDLGSLNKIGDLLLRVGDKVKAIECFSKIGEQYASDGFNLRAIAMFKKCTRTDPTRHEFHERLADLNAQQGLTNEAKANYTIVAEHYLKEGKNDRAREVYAKIAEIEPDNLKNRLKLADLYLKDNQLNLALGEYQIIGTELAKKGMLDESVQVLEKALGLDPSNVDILRTMARTHAEMGRAEQGVQFIRSKLDEKGGNDPDLLLVLGETYQAGGNLQAAQQALSQALEAAPGRVDVHAALSSLYLQAGDADTALQQYVPVADGLVAKGKGEEAIEGLRAILREREDHVPTLEKLLELQVQLGGDEKVQADGLSKLSEAYIAQGRYDEAEKTLTRLTGLEPDVAQHAEKLDFVRSKVQAHAAGEDSGTFAAAQAQQGSAEDMSFGSLSDGDEGGFSMSFDDGELDAPPADDRAEFVSEGIAEADVFIKYGLVDKAVEQLQAILNRYGDDIDTRLKLKQLYVDEGRKGEAIEQCLEIAKLLKAQGDATGEAEAIAQARELDPNHPALVSGAFPAVAGAAAAAPAGGDLEMSFDAGDSSGGGGDLEMSFDSGDASGGGDFEMSVDDGGSSSGGDFEMTFDSDDSGGGEVEMTFDSDGGSDGEVEMSFDSDGGSDGEVEMTFDSDDSSSTDFEVSVDEPDASGFEVSLDDEPAAEVASEISFDDGASAAGEMEVSLDSDGGGEMALSVDGGAAATSPSGFEIAVDTEDAASAAPAAAVEESGFAVAVDAPEPMAETAAIPVQDVAPQPAAPPAPEPAVPEPEPAEPAAAEEDEGLFGSEDDFFDLAAELNDELSTETDVSRGSDEDMSLEQIVDGIQKGVAAQVDQEDYETHYNLGIAYKEMGLADEAIGEFQYAAKDPTKFLQCCILLGACFTEKGMPDLAIKWYEKGRASTDVSDEDALALRYETAQCREALGEDEAALEEYLDVYAMNAKYRETAERVATLKAKLGR